MTVSDFAAFWDAFFEQIPHARMFVTHEYRDGIYPEISLAEATAKFEDDYGVSFVVVFEGEDWRPEFAPDPDYPGTGLLTLTNRPILLLSYNSGHVQKVEESFLKSPIYVHRPGGLAGSNFAEDEEGKRIVDTAFRILRKLSDNRFRVADLISGAHVQDEKFDQWYGPDMASYCLANPGNYLGVMFSDQSGNYWGYLPVVEP